MRKPYGDNLSPSEQRVYDYLMKPEYYNKLIAYELGIKTGTVVFHTVNIFKKKNVHSRAELLEKVKNEELLSQRSGSGIPEGGCEIPPSSYGQPQTNAFSYQDGDAACSEKEKA